MNYIMKRDNNSDQDFSRHEIGSLILIDRGRDWTDTLNKSRIVSDSAFFDTYMTMKYKFKASLMMYVNSTKLLLTMDLGIKVIFKLHMPHGAWTGVVFTCELWHELSSLVDVDYVTPLCSQLTYEGLLDETFGIKCGTRTKHPPTLPLQSQEGPHKILHRQLYLTLNCC